MDQVIINLSDPHLFGNEAAEDEQPEVFNAYAYERPEVAIFCDPNYPIQIIRGFKGEGKSALMRLARVKIEENHPEQIVIETTGPNLTPRDADNFDLWVREWKKAVFDLIASEIGSRIGFAWGDDAIVLVEIAEKKGFKSRNLVSSIADRLKTKAVPIERTRLDPQDSGRILQRWNEKSPGVWIFIDDIDRNFDGSRRDCIKIAAFFDAIRSIFKDVDSIKFRCAIRPNTLIMLKREYEGLSHIEQYTSDIAWSEHDFLFLLGRRIEGYLNRTGQTDYLPNKSIEENERSRELMKFIFETPVQWGDKMRPVHVPLYTLSQHRPRWLIELCRVSARRAVQNKHARIERTDIISDLGEFGMRRLHDTIAEFSVQSPQIHEILDAFRGQSEEYTTAQLINLIKNRILSHVTPTLPSVLGKPNEREIAGFLFKIGFIYARKDYEDGSYDHIGYVDQPTLLTSRTDIDSGCTWEIPPIYRQALDLRTQEGLKRPITKRNSDGTPERSKRRIVRDRPSCRE